MKGIMSTEKDMIEHYMKESDRQLLLKDLCMRLPYGVRCTYPNDIGLHIPITEINVHDDGLIGIHGRIYNLYEIKPYLRPISSMTEEEKIELYTRAYAPDEMKTLDEKLYVIQTNAKNAADFYNEHHLDYRGLIEKGLALEAPKDIV